MLADEIAATRYLNRLSLTYPEFTFSRELFGWKGVRWVAERKDEKSPA